VSTAVVIEEAVATTAAWAAPSEVALAAALMVALAAALEVALAAALMVEASGAVAATGEAIRVGRPTSWTAATGPKINEGLGA